MNIRQAANIAEAATGRRAFVAGKTLLLDSTTDRTTAVAALTEAGYTVEATTAKFPGRPITKPAVRFV